MNTRRVGTDKERLAADYLAGQGMQILEQNFYTRQGEVDLIGLHEGYLVFVEVKEDVFHFMGFLSQADVVIGFTDSCFRR